MDRINKIEEIKQIELAILKNKQSIKVEQEKIEFLNKRIHELETQKELFQISELPILLFMINKTCPMPNDERDYKFEYIYYCPDLDEIQYKESNKYNDFLPNTIDLRYPFRCVGIPSETWTQEIQFNSDYVKKIKIVVSYLKDTIDNLFNMYQINSWDELKEYLCNVKIDNDVPKILKKIDKSI